MNRWAGLCLLLLVPGLLRAEPEALEQLNEMRRLAGLPPFELAEPLSRAAADQAHYLTLGQRLDHLQDPGDPGFTGETPGQRALVRAWPARAVRENFSRGQSNWPESLEGLMAAIYHRFAFLDPGMDKIGLARSGSGPSGSFVYLMGSALTESLCQNTQLTKTGNRGVCGGSAWVSLSLWQEALDSSLAKAPRMVIWPAEGALVPPAFFEETPDPLPDRYYSGYPVTIAFNPARFKTPPKIEFWKLFDAQGQEVDCLPVLNASTDPNQKLNQHQHALFPQDRLKWGGSYQVQVRYRADGLLVERRWGFQVKATRFDRLNIKGQGEWVAVTPGQSVSLFLPPSTAHPTFGNLDWSAREGVRAELDWEDKNTLALTPAGDLCGRLHFKLSGGRRFQVVVMPPGPEGPITNQAPLCVPPALQGYHGYYLKDQTEVPTKGRFWFLMPEDWSGSTRLSFVAPKSMKVKLRQVGEVLLELEVEGRKGQQLQLKWEAMAPLNLRLTDSPPRPDFLANQ
ncbi:MAG: CAP domain-containing protein [bacterium]|nr:CAP domain-containing protein [bacterium]